MDRRLRELAAEYGVATEYEDQTHSLVQVHPDAVRKVLAALGVAAERLAATAEGGTPEGTDAGADPGTDAAASLSSDAVPSVGPGASPGNLPPTVVVTAGRPGPLPPQAVTVELEDGGSVETTADRLGELPLGWHTIRAGAAGAGTPDGTAVVPDTKDAGAGSTRDAAGAASTLVVAPPRAPLPPRLWGWMVQLYALRSAGSWGLGDLADLAELARWSGTELGAGLVLVNPLHAVAPVLPIEPSPYYPTSRRFTNPIYLRIEQTPEYAAADAATKHAVDALGEPLRARNREDFLDRDAVWTAKLAALEVLWPAARRHALGEHRRRTPGLEDFALFCALTERHGIPWQTWPAGLHDPAGSEAVSARGELSERVAFFSWLQLLCAEQLAAAQQAATNAGMPVGIVHDLAVGVDPGGADAWALQDVLAIAATVGAPPDAFNQKGQNWRLPPWHPRRLAEAGYAPYRDLLRSILGSGGGVRIDHILGLFRLWWVPEGSSAAEGSYVRYDDEALLGVLALEAHRAGAVVIGEDLGTVEQRVQTALVDRGILGSSVLWFERESDPETSADGPLKAPGDWRELALASISTHDLPTAAGFLAGEHVTVRAELGQLTRPVEAERAAAERERAELLALLAELGVLPPGDDLILALHALLARTPCRLLVAQPGDAVGDRRQPNLPGTTDEYPNWRLPIRGPGGPLTLEDLKSAERVGPIARLLARTPSA